jgi:hypothetical protein
MKIATARQAELMRLFMDAVLGNRIWLTHAALRIF